MALVLSGAGSDDGSLDGECNAWVRYAHALYGPDTPARSSVPTGPALGNGEEVDCDGSLVVNRTFELHSLVGVDPATAVAVTTRRRQLVYGNQDVPVTSWPPSLTEKPPRSAARSGARVLDPSSTPDR